MEDFLIVVMGIDMDLMNLIGTVNSVCLGLETMHLIHAVV